MRKLILLLLLCCSGLSLASIYIPPPCYTFVHEEGYYLDGKKHGQWAVWVVRECSFYISIFLQKGVDTTVSAPGCGYGSIGYAQESWSEGSYINGKKEGWWVGSNVDPFLVDDFKVTALRTQGNYTNGKEDCWDENGQETASYQYLNNCLTLGEAVVF